MVNEISAYIGKIQLYTIYICLGEMVASVSDHPHMRKVSDSWKHDVYAYFLTGVGLQELYIQPQHMTDGHWEVIAKGKKFYDGLAEYLKIPQVTTLRT